MLLNSQIITCIIYNLAIIGSKSKAAIEELHSLKYLLTKKIIRIWMCHFQTVQKIQLKESWAFSFLHGQISLLHFHLFWHFHPLSFNQTLQGTNINFKWSLLVHSLRPQQLIFKPWRDPVGASHCLLPYRREFFHWLSLEKLPGSQRSYWRSWWLRRGLHWLHGLTKHTFSPLKARDGQEVWVHFWTVTDTVVMSFASQTKLFSSWNSTA